MMTIGFSRLLKGAVLVSLTASLYAQAPATPAAAKPKPEETEIWEPVPAVVTPGATLGAAPSDAIVLFGGSNVDEWVSIKDHGPAKWDIHDGVMTVAKSAGGIETK